MTFQNLGLSSEKILANLTERYETSTELQDQSVPFLLLPFWPSFIIRSASGTGKTVAILSSLINHCVRKNELAIGQRKHNEVFAVMVSPSNDSAIDLLNEALELSKETGVSIQHAILNKDKLLENFISRCDILIGTVDALNESIFNQKKYITEHICFLAVDEANVVEEDPNFIEFYGKLFHGENDAIPIMSTSQMDYESKLNLTGSYTTDYSTDFSFQRFGHAFVDLSPALKDERALPKIQFLFEFLKDRTFPDRKQKRCPKTLIFVNDIRTANFVTICLLKLEYLACCVHEEKADSENEQTYKKLDKGKLDIIVSTNIFTIESQPSVNFLINYQLPTEIQDYQNFIRRFQQVIPVNVSVLSLFDSAENSNIAYQLKKFFEGLDCELPDYIMKAYKAKTRQFIRNVDRMKNSLRILGTSFNCSIGE